MAGIPGKPFEIIEFKSMLYRVSEGLSTTKQVDVTGDGRRVENVGD